MNTILIILVALLALAGLCWALRTPPQLVAWNYGAVYQGGEITRTAESALSDQHLLVKKGTGALQIDACGATDMPLGFADDEAAADEEINIGLLDGSTRRGVAAKAIAVNDPVYTAASGQVTDTPVTGCYYIGRALTAAAAAADELVIATAPPVLVDSTQLLTTCSGSASGADLTVSGQVTDAAGNALAGRFIVSIYFGEAANDGTPNDFGDLAADTGSVIVVEHTADAYCEVLTAADGSWGVVLTVGVDDTVESNAWVNGRVATDSTAVDVP